MKRLLLIVGVLGLLAGLVYGVTQTQSEGAAGGRARYSAFKKLTIAATGTPPADFTETLVPVYGIIYRIVIDTTGADTDFTITLKDENAKTIFTGSNLSSASEPYGYAVYEDDTEGNPWAGVPVGGAMTLTMADGDDATMTAISVHIYYLEFWR